MVATKKNNPARMTAFQESVPHVQLGLRIFPTISEMQQRPQAVLEHHVRHSRQKVPARSAVPFAVKLLPGYHVDGTWNVLTTLTFVGCVMLGYSIR
jgi:hypothetical protein